VKYFPLAQPIQALGTTNNNRIGLRAGLDMIIIGEGESQRNYARKGLVIDAGKTLSDPKLMIRGKENGYFNFI
jgi:hypothetical protein